MVIIRRALLIFSVFFILVSPITLSARPHYSFCSCVFSNLPEYPEDFIEIKNLFNSGKLDIHRLSPAYYTQPEFYPNWNSIANITYSNKTHYGVYGFNIYPSSYSIYTQAGETHDIYAFLNNNFGISVKTGVQLNISFNSSIVSIKQIQPTTPYFLLDETYPNFQPNWSQLLHLQITILKNISTNISIYNAPPPSFIDSIWRELYPNNYTTPGTFASSIPNLKIKITTPTDTIPPEKIEEQNTILIIGILITSIMVGLGIWLKRKK